MEVVLMFPHHESAFCCKPEYENDDSDTQNTVRNVPLTRIHLCSFRQGCPTSLPPSHKAPISESADTSFTEVTASEATVVETTEAPVVEATEAPSAEPAEENRVPMSIWLLILLLILIVVVIIIKMLRKKK